MRNFNHKSNEILIMNLFSIFLSESQNDSCAFTPVFASLFIARNRLIGLVIGKHLTKS